MRHSRRVSSKRKRWLEESSWPSTRVVSTAKGGEERSRRLVSRLAGARFSTEAHSTNDSEGRREVLSCFGHESGCLRVFVILLNYIYIYVPWRLKRVLEARWRLRTIREGLPSERDGGGLRPYRFESSTSYLPRGNRLERKFKLSVVITLFSGFHILLFIHMYSY